MISKRITNVGIIFSSILMILFQLSSMANESLMPEPSSKDNAPTQYFGLLSKKWAHGAKDCKSNQDGQFDILSVSDDTHILRQNKCTTFEAPFLYVLEGDERTLLIDTGAIKQPETSSVLAAVRSLVEFENDRPVKPLFIIHSHAHNDHVNGDKQFAQVPNTSVLKPTRKAISSHFNLVDWPNDTAKLELGGRTLTLIPTPGHQEDAITLYDPQTEYLFTGDTVYPGQIFVKDWHEYRNSILRLAKFANANNVKAVLGAHIEMTIEPGKMYDIGTTYQPNETILPLHIDDLHNLAELLKQTPKAKELKFDKMIVTPMNFIQKTLSNVLSVFF